METTVITACYYPDTSKISTMLESARRVGITVEPYGVGEPYGGFMDSKCVKLIPVLEKITTKYVLYVDGADLVFQKSLEEIEARYKRIADERILVAGDHSLHPFGRKKNWFVKRAPDGCRFPYPCVGVFMGPKTELIRAMQRMLDLREKIGNIINDKFYENDQGWWVLGMTHGRFQAVIDYDCLVSVSLHYYKKEWFMNGMTPRRMENRVRPCIIHFNGKSIKKPVYRQVLGEMNLG